MQKKRIALFWVKLLAFLLILGVACNVVGDMLGADTITGYAVSFLHIPRNSVDVVWVGSSHQFCGIVPQLLYDEHGITSALAAGIEMDMNSNYWQLRHILLTQSPKVVVLDMFAAASAYAYSSSVGLTPLTSESEPLPEDRAYVLTAVARWIPFNSPYKVPATLEAYIRTGEDGPAFFQITKKHEDIARVGRAHFALLTGQMMFNKNFGYSYHAEQLLPEWIKLDTYTEDELAGVSLEETNVAELERIIDLCRQHNIQLIFSAAPYVMDAAEEKRMALLEAFAQQHGVPFVGPEASGIEDLGYFRDIGHLNYLGAELYTAFWGDYLARHYDLPDHRDSTDARYAPWRERVGSHQEQVAAYTLYSLQDPGLTEYLEQVSLLGDDYLVLVSVQGDVYEGFTDDDYLLMTDELGMTDEATEEWYAAGTGTLDAITRGGKLVWSRFDGSGQSEPFQYDVEGYNVSIDITDGVRRWFIDSKPAGTLGEGFNIAVFNLMENAYEMDFRTFDITEINIDDE